MMYVNHNASMLTLTDADVDKEFTSQIQHYLNDGYMVSQLYASVIQSWYDTSVSLVKGNRLVVVSVVTEDAGCNNYKTTNVSSREITIDRFGYPMWLSWKTPNHPLMERKFYSLDKEHYTNDIDVAKKCASIRNNREYINTRETIRGIKCDANKLVKLVKKHKGYGRVKASDVCYLGRKDNTYVVSVIGKPCITWKINKEV